MLAAPSGRAARTGRVRSRDALAGSRGGRFWPPRFWRARRAAAPLALLAVLAVGSAAQTPDTVSVGVTPALAGRPDSLSRPVGGDLVVPLGPEPGRVVAPTPALTAALDPTDLLAEAPGAFLYRLSAPGRAALSFDGLPPETPALVLDGRPFDDLLTGAPRFDLLPSEAAAPLRLADTRHGRVGAVEASTRPFRAAVPITELRYFGGQRGVQYASGTHAQTRRAPRLLGGGADSRMTLTGHVATRASNGRLGTSAFGRSSDGARERHSHALGRLLLTRPGLAVEAGDLYTEQLDGAQRGLTGDVFTILGATALDGTAERKTIRNDLWLTAWAGATSSPLELGAAWTSQRWRYVRTAGDTLAADAGRVSGHVRQRVRLGPARLHLRAGATFDTVSDTAGVFAPGGRLGLHASVLDSLALGPLRLALQAGLHRADDDTAPALAARAEAGALSAGLRYGRGTDGRLWDGGLGGRIEAAPSAAERVWAADVGVGATVGAVRGALRLSGSRREDPRWLVSRGDTAYAVVASASPATRVGATAEAWWREGVRRGLYLRGALTATHALDADASDLHRRDARSLPTVWARVRFGLRAEGVGDGVADLDLALVARGWSALAGRVVEPATGLTALPDPDGALGTSLPTRGTLGAEATATFSERASVFLRYDNALAGRLYDGALVVPGEPIPSTALRFGVFWALLN